MMFKRRLLQTSVLSAAVFSTAATGASAADLIIDSPPAYEVNGPENYGVVWVGVDNPSQGLLVNPAGTLGSGSAALGVNAASDGNTATVTGAWTNTGNFTLGYEGASNTLSISGAGELSTGSLWLGGFSGATGNQATVDGASAKLSTTGDLAIGYGSNGNSVTAKNGAVVTTTTNLEVGFDGDGNTLNVESGASVTSGDDVRIGASAGSDNNIVTVEGAGSTLTVNSSKTLYVGRSGNNNGVVIEDQGKLYTRNARIGGSSDSAQVTSGNSVTVNGQGSRWELTGTLRVGDGSLFASSDNGLYVEDGGTVELMDENRGTFIGFTAADTGNTIRVSGTGSSFTAGDVSVGLQATNSLLEASDGGSITVRDIGVGGTSTLRIGEDSSIDGRNLTLQDGATLSVDISETDPVSIDFTGTVELDGTLEADVVSANLVPGRYDVVTAGIVSGTFDQFVVTGAINNFTAALGYDPTAAYILFSAELGLGVDLNQNQSNVAGALDEYYNSGGAMTGPISSLYDLTGADLETALTEVSGEVGASGGVNAIKRATTSFLNLMLGGGGQSAAPFSARQQAAVTISTGVVPTADTPPPVSNGWSLWGGVYGGAANLPGSSSKGSHDTETNFGGIAAGWDYNVADETRVGIAVAGGQTNWDLDSNLGSGDSTFFQLGAYGTQHFGATYLSLAGAYAWHSMSTERRVNVDGTEKLDADFDASNLAGRIEAGHRFAAGEQLGLTPYAALQAQAVYMPGYDEDGGSFALDYNANTATALRTELGVGIDTALGDDPSVARLFGRVAWAHDWNSDANVQASFASLDMSTFTVHGAEAPDNIALVTAGAEFGLTEATEFAATFDGEFADGYQSYAGSLTLTYSW